MSRDGTPWRDRLARRWLLYFLVAIATGGIVLLRQQARRADAGRTATLVAAAPLGGDLHLTLEGGRRYRVEVVGDRARLARLPHDRARLIDVNSRAATPIAASPTGQPARDVGNDRIRQTLGTVVAPNDGEFLVRLETTAAIDGVAIDSLLVSQLPTGRALSQSFGMLALGGLVFLVVLAIGGLLGRSVLDADAT